MERLTQKIDLDKTKPCFVEAEHYKEYKSKCNKESINKLGQIEDIMEYYKIEDIQELDSILDHYFRSLRHGII